MWLLAAAAAAAVTVIIVRALRKRAGAHAPPDTPEEGVGAGRGSRSATSAPIVLDLAALAASAIVAVLVLIGAAWPAAVIAVIACAVAGTAWLLRRRSSAGSPQTPRAALLSRAPVIMITAAMMLTLLIDWQLWAILVVPEALMAAAALSPMGRSSDDAAPTLLALRTGFLWAGTLVLLTSGALVSTDGLAWTPFLGLGVITLLVGILLDYACAVARLRRSVERW